MKFNFEIFNDLDTKESRREYLFTLDKEQFKHKPFGSSYAVWKCPDPKCLHQSLNKANLFKHIAVPCKILSQWSCPYNYWQEDLSLSGNFNIAYPDIYIEKLFKNYVIKKIQSNPEDKQVIFNSFTRVVFGDLWTRSKFNSFTKTVDNKVWIKDKQLLWVESKTPEGNLIITKIIDKYILNFISTNIMGWVNWHSANLSNMNIFYEFRNKILNDREHPSI